MTTQHTYSSVAQQATRRNVSPRTFRRWVKDGLIPVHRFSARLLRFRDDEVDAALAKFRIPARGEKGAA